MDEKNKTYKILSLDGGGMKGIYSAQYLLRLAQNFNDSDHSNYDIGKGFDLITGTSTGGIIACALFAGIDLAQIVQLYRDKATKIFPLRLKKDVFDLLTKQLPSRKEKIEEGSLALKQALTEVFQDLTIEQVYERRKIALCIPTVNISRPRKNWVFKTPHHPESSKRDNPYSIVDICMATSAAPIYLSLAHIKEPEDHFFVDGGLWVNNPSLLSILEALDLGYKNIEVYCLGTLPRPTQIDTSEKGNLGLSEWGFGAGVLELSMDVQQTAYDGMSMILSRSLERQGFDIKVVRLPNPNYSSIPPSHLSLDSTSQEELESLIQLANQAADDVHSSYRSGEEQSAMVADIFKNLSIGNHQKEEVNYV